MSDKKEDKKFEVKHLIMAAALGGALVYVGQKLLKIEEENIEYVAADSDVASVFGEKVTSITNHWYMNPSVERRESIVKLFNCIYGERCKIDKSCEQLNSSYCEERINDPKTTNIGLVFDQTSNCRAILLCEYATPVALDVNGNIYKICVCYISLVIATVPSDTDDEAYGR